MIIVLFDWKGKLGLERLCNWFYGIGLRSEWEIGDGFLVGWF